MALVYSLLTFVSLGLAYPMMRTALQQYKMNHTRFGDRRFAFDGNGGGIFPAWLFFIVGCIVTLALSIVAIWQPAQTWPILTDTDGNATAEFLRAVLDDWRAAAAVIAAAAALLLFVRYRAHEFRYFVSAMRFDTVRFDVRSSVGMLVLISIVHLVVWVGAFAAAAVVIAIVGAALGAGLNTVGQPVYIVLVVMLTFFVVSPLVKYVVLYHAVLSYVCARFGISDLDAVDGVVQSIRESPRFGEGLADALDVDMGAI